MPAAKYKYVEGSSTKTCSKCDTEKPLTDFVKNSRCRGGVSNTCKVCENKRQKVFRDVAKVEDPTWIPRRLLSQEKDRAKRYGLTLEELERMKDESKGLCEICSQPPSGTGTSSKVLHVDHCHATGNVRGMLCSRCNLVIGRVEEDQGLLQGMIEYLKKHKKGEECLSI